MKTMLIALLAVATASTARLQAQTGSLPAKTGTATPYDMRSALNLTLTIQGKEISTESTSDGSVSLLAKKVGKQKIDWVYAMGPTHTRTTSAMLPKPIDSSFKTKPLAFTTDLVGRILGAPSIDAQAALASGPLAGDVFRMLFSPLLARPLQAGDSWQETRIDTVPAKGLSGTMHVHRTVKYIYDGVVDTLDVKAERVRSEVTSMTVDGSVSMQGLQMDVTGDGSATSVMYYHVTDHLMLVTKTEMEMNMNMVVGGGMEMIIPVKQRMTTSVARH